MRWGGKNEIQFQTLANSSTTFFHRLRNNILSVGGERVTSGGNSKVDKVDVYASLNEMYREQT